LFNCTLELAKKHVLARMLLNANIEISTIQTIVYVVYIKVQGTSDLTDLCVHTLHIQI